MELLDTIKMIKEFGITPVLLGWVIWYWWKNGEKIIERISSKIIENLNCLEHGKTMKKALITKDLEILYWALQTRITSIIDRILSLYTDPKTQEKSKITEIIQSEFLESKFVEFIDINEDIKDRFLKNIHPEEFIHFLEQIKKAITINGTNIDLFKELISGYGNSYIEEVLKTLNSQFLLE